MLLLYDQLSHFGTLVSYYSYYYTLTCLPSMDEYT
jgi:hypothetical protein